MAERPRPKPVDDNTAIRRELARLTDQMEVLTTVVAEALRARESATDEMLNAKEAAELLRVCTKTLTHMVRRDGLPSVRVGGQNRYRRSDIMAWLEKRPERPRAHAARHGETMRLAAAGRT